MMIEIKSKDSRIPEALDALCYKNRDRFISLGFMAMWVKDESVENRYVFYTRYSNPLVKISFEKVGKGLIIKTMKDTFRKIDKDCIIREIDEKEMQKGAE
jgi:hypothetical protein